MSAQPKDWLLEMLGTGGKADLFPVVPGVFPESKRLEPAYLLDVPHVPHVPRENGDPAKNRKKPTDACQVRIAANDPPPRQSAGLHFRLLAGGGGSMIDPDGVGSAVRDLQSRYGKRLDWQDLARGLHQSAPDDVDALALVDALAESQAEMLGQAGYD